MSKIRSMDTRPELKLKRILLKSGFNYQPKHIYGNPDFANKKELVAIFIDGCFWHSCEYHGHLPKSNKVYWKVKLQRNKKG